MNLDEAADRDAEFLRRLVTYEEALATGHPPLADATTPPELAERLQRAQACVRRLRRDRRPADAPAPPDVSPLVSGAGLAFDPAGGLTCLGRFEIIRELGRGGCGIVYLARDPLLSREVALKVPRLEALVTPELRRRFLREARLAADIDHPNVVAVHEAGEVGPVCYLVSAYCPGKTLAAWLQEQPGPVPTDVAAALVATLAEAVHHVHGRGILHRDLKPANILIQKNQTTDYTDNTDQNTEENPCDPCNPWFPKITDFGLAKWVEGPGGETRTGMAIGTPRYMAPEQAECRTRDIGPATDVYALGVILYELLTGRTPFQADSDQNVLNQIVTQEPPSPRQLRPQVARDLETICRKCLEKEPAKRYTSAEALADDLGRFLAGRPLQARPVGTLERLGKWLRRRPAVAALVGVCTLALVGSVLAAVLYSIQLGQHNAELQATLQRERDERDRADERQQQVRRYAYARQFRFAAQVWRI